MSHASDSTPNSPSAPAASRHWIGAIDGEAAPSGANAKLLVLTGAVHGNEPGGVVAIERVLDALDGIRPGIDGRVVGLIGNPTAFERDDRYVDHDLNRIWTDARIARAQTDPAVAGVDERAMLALMELLGAELKRAGNTSEALVLDLHSMSGDGPPFLVIADEHRPFGTALDIEVPIVFGLESQFGGSMLDWARTLGYRGIAFEGGASDDPNTTRCHEALIWRTLLVTGIVRPDALTDAIVAHIRDLDRTMTEQGRGLPRYLDVFYRHGVKPSDRFRMEAGFKSFQPVEAGQLLAHDRNGPVFASQQAVLLMPLYQRQGNDGFFLGRRLSPTTLDRGDARRAS